MTKLKSTWFGQSIQRLFAKLPNGLYGHLRYHYRLSKESFKQTKRRQS